MKQTYGAFTQMKILISVIWRSLRKAVRANAIMHFMPEFYRFYNICPWHTTLNYRPSTSIPYELWGVGECSLWGFIFCGALWCENPVDLYIRCSILNGLSLSSVLLTNRRSGSYFGCLSSRKANLQYADLHLFLHQCKWCRWNITHIPPFHKIITFATP